MMKLLRLFLVFCLSAPHALMTMDLKKELDDYFTRLKRGTHCYLQGKPCSSEDKKAVFQAIGAISGMLALLSIGGGMVYVGRRNPYKSWPQAKKDVELIQAAYEGNYKKVDSLLKASADPDTKTNQFMTPLDAVVEGIIYSVAPFDNYLAITKRLLGESIKRYGDVLTILQALPDDPGKLDFMPYVVHKPEEISREKYTVDILPKLQQMKELLETYIASLKGR